MTTCVSCNAELDDRQTFCDGCGAPQEGGPQRTGRQAVVAPVQQSPVYTGSASPGACISCGRDPGVGQACQSCRHVTGMPAGISLSTPGRRFGGYVLEGVLMVVTLGIGWLVWVIFFTAKHGQTPAKQLLGMRVVKTQSHKVAGWGDMFVRDVVYKNVISAAVVFFTFGLFAISYFWLLWDRNNQQLWDKMGATIVVDDPENALA